eukprot:2978782-Amphidinium_carterae.1
MQKCSVCVRASQEPPTYTATDDSNASQRIWVIQKCTAKLYPNYLSMCCNSDDTVVLRVACSNSRHRMQKKCWTCTRSVT